MKHNTTREKIAWLAVIAVILTVSFGLFKLADVTQAWLTGDGAVEEAALQRPAPARNDAPLPADIERQKQQMQKKQPNPGGWATGGPALEFRPGPAFKQFYNNGGNGKSTQTPPQPEPEQNKSHKMPKDKPGYRGVDPNESMEEFWQPDYYEEGIDL